MWTLKWFLALSLWEPFGNNIEPIKALAYANVIVFCYAKETAYGKEAPNSSRGIIGAVKGSK